MAGSAQAESTGAQVVLSGPSGAVPEALAELHAGAPVGATITVRFPDGKGWSPRRRNDVIVGAGFRRRRAAPTDPHRDDLTLVRLRTLPDRVAPAMRILMCGLNPSVLSADVGVGFARRGNRFWPAAVSAGIVEVEREPTEALHAHGMGMTDLVKRATARADGLRTEEYRSGLARVTRLAEWLSPAVVCFVGLSGWRAAVDRHAVAGWQPHRLGVSAVYVMPSTSGLNAHAQLAQLTDHLRTAVAGP